MPARNSEKYAENPFLSELYHDSKPVTKRVTAPSNDLMVTSKDSLVSTDASVGLIFQHTIESNEFVKMYTKGVAAMWGLSSAGKKVFMLLFNEYSGKQGINKDTVTLYYPALSEDARNWISYRLFNKGINDLIKHHFIAESIIPSQFYINPTFFFNGDRLAIIHTYQRKTQDKLKKLEEQGQIPLL